MDIKKKEFNRPSDLTEVEPHGSIAPEIAPPTGILSGNWVNVDPATRSIVRVNFAGTGVSLKVHAYGACSPTPCDWGAVTAHSYAANVSSAVTIAFTATYTTSFSQIVLAGHVSRGLLTVDSFTRFTDGSSRSDYTSHDTFHHG